MTSERLAEIERKHACTMKWAGACDACEVFTALWEAHSGIKSLQEESDQYFTEIKTWRTKALVVEHHPVVVALRDERDTLQRRVKALETLLQEMVSGPRHGGEWWVEQAKSILLAGEQND